MLLGFFQKPDEIIQGRKKKWPSISLGHNFGVCLFREWSGSSHVTYSKQDPLTLYNHLIWAHDFSSSLRALIELSETYVY